MSEVSDYSWTDESGSHHPAEAAYAKFGGRLIAVEGILQTDAVRPALACHVGDGLHVPADPNIHSKIPLTGKVPSKRGKRYLVVGRLTRNEMGPYSIAVERWETLEE